MASQRVGSIERLGIYLFATYSEKRRVLAKERKASKLELHSTAAQYKHKHRGLVSAWTFINVPQLLSLVNWRPQFHFITLLITVPCPRTLVKGSFRKGSNLFLLPWQLSIQCRHPISSITSSTLFVIVGLIQSQCRLWRRCDFISPRSPGAADPPSMRHVSANPRKAGGKLRPWRQKPRHHENQEKRR